jgi:hypothetical protein
MRSIAGAYRNRRIETGSPGSETAILPMLGLRALPPAQQFCRALRNCGSISDLRRKQNEVISHWTAQDDNFCSELWNWKHSSSQHQLHLQLEAKARLVISCPQF